MVVMPDIILAIQFYAAGTSNGQEVDFLPAATPIPGALSLFGGGLAVFGVIARRRKQKSAATACSRLVEMADWIW